MNNIDSIVLHCSATPEGKDFTAADINRMHIQRGFRCIGYHYVIRLDGTIEKGRQDYEVGAHCNTSGKSGRSYNYHSIGICIIGGYAKDGKTVKDTRTPAQKEALIRLMTELVGKYPIKEILGHRDTGANKACPCFDAIPEYKHLLKK